VFAIGALLWELCAVPKLPPSDAGDRRRVLRRAGIDPDLAAIIDKAVAASPAQRYPDAGALAADLKAFKAGARIAGRRYSLLAVLGHWLRRHRAVAVASLAAVIVAIAVGALYVRGITVERDRAEASNNRLILEHAELVVQADPTAAYDLLQTYDGHDAQRLAMLRAQAQGLGLSRMRARPHAQAIYFAQPLADGAIVTFAADGRIARTTADGTSRVIAQGANPQPIFAYSDARTLLAYTSDPAGVRVLDVRGETPRTAPPAGAAWRPIALAFSPSGALLAGLSADGAMAIWQIASEGAIALRSHVPIGAARSIRFVDDQTLVVPRDRAIAVVELDAAGRSSRVTEIAVPDPSDVSPSGELHVVAVAAGTGHAILIDSQSHQVISDDSLCVGAVARVAVLTRAAVAYACQDGNAGLWNPAQHSHATLAYLQGGATTVRGTADGRTVLFAGGNGRLLSYDLQTQVVSDYLGHTAPVTAVTPPSPSLPFFLSGDTTGALRAWSLPDDSIRAPIIVPSAVYKAILLPRHGPLIAITELPKIPWYDRDGHLGEFADHVADHEYIAVSPTRPRFAMYGGDRDVELWSTDAPAGRRTLSSAHGDVTGVAFTANGTRVATGSIDGTITEWVDGDPTGHDLGSIHEPIAFLRTAPLSDTIIAAGASGALWRWTPAGVTKLARDTPLITAVAYSRNARWLAIGDPDGAVRLYDVATGQVATVFHARSPVEYAAFSPDDRELAISADDRVSMIAAEPPATAGAERASWAPPAPAWTDVAISARNLSFSPDGNWLAATCDHGGIWFYQRHSQRWFYRSVGTAKLRYGEFSDDSERFSAADSSGRALVVDMTAPHFN
jgi:WD40 repeat protein